MKTRLFNLMACPECRADLQLHTFALEQDEIVDGALLCPECRMIYYIVDTVPRMLPRTLYDNPEFALRYEDQLVIIAGEYGTSTASTDRLTQHKQNTSKAFGDEWETFNRFGYDHDVFQGQTERNRFYVNTFLQQSDLEGKLYLDGGCGNGRYSLQSLQQGAEVVAVDLSHAVDTARKNLKEYSDRAHFVQGDLFKLPFKPAVFDGAFSIGVLMHTGNTQAAFKSIASHVKRTGLIGISVYQKQNPLHEFNDWWIRELTIRMPSRALYHLSRWMAGFANLAHRVRLLGLVNAFFRLEPYHLCVYDWYKAPVAHHHTRDEVQHWFEDVGAGEILHDDTPEFDHRGPIRKWIWPRCGFTVRGRLT